MSEILCYGMQTFSVGLCKILQALETRWLDYLISLSAWAKNKLNVASLTYGL
jgi:hypothetical protein